MRFPATRPSKAFAYVVALLAAVVASFATDADGNQVQAGDRSWPGAVPSASDQCAPAFNLFGVGNWPPACWRPYSDASPFNQPIPPKPRLHPRSGRIVKRLLGFGPPAPERAGTADSSDDYSTPVYFARGGDPVITLRGSSSSPVNGHRIRVPAGARPAAGSDHHMAIVQRDGWEYDLYDARRPSRGTLRYDSGRRIRIEGSGLRSGATASRFGNLAGRVRAAELAAGQINHALVMVVDCTSGRHVWPAAKTDSKCRNPVDAPPMGARFQLAMSDGRIDALGVPAWKKTILRAMARYGGYVGDSSSSPWSLTAFESGSTYTSFGFEDPMVQFARRVGIRSNGDGLYVFDMEHGVDWKRHLRVIHPSVARH